MTIQRDYGFLKDDVGISLAKPRFVPQFKLKFDIYTISTVIAMLGIFIMVGIRIYSSIMLFPMGKIIRAKEDEYETVTDMYFHAKNENAYNDSTQLIETVARNELDMDKPDEVIYLSTDEQILAGKVAVGSTGVSQ